MRAVEGNTGCAGQGEEEIAAIMNDWEGEQSELPEDLWKSSQKKEMSECVRKNKFIWYSKSAVS